jgi:hypothetical protein
MANRSIQSTCFFFGLYVTALAGVKIPSLTSSSAGGTPTPTPTPPAGQLLAGLGGNRCPASERALSDLKAP